MNEIRLEVILIQSIDSINLIISVIEKQVRYVRKFPPICPRGRLVSRSIPSNVDRQSDGLDQGGSGKRWHQVPEGHFYLAQAQKLRPLNAPPIE